MRARSVVGWVFYGVFHAVFLPQAVIRLGFMLTFGYREYYNTWFPIVFGFAVCGIYNAIHWPIRNAFKKKTSVRTD
jgi:hypothetical protein